MSRVSYLIKSARVVDRIDITPIANMLWGVTFGRTVAATIYLAGTTLWAVLMGFSSLFGCEGGCFGDETERLDLALVLGCIGLLLAAAAFVGSMVSRQSGFWLLGLHAVVFGFNVVAFFAGRDVGIPWAFVLSAAIVAAAGYLAVGGLQPARTSDHPS